MKRFLTGIPVATALLIAPTSALSAPTCVTEREFKAGIAFFMPSMVRAVRSKCESTLGNASYLVRRGDDFAARFKTADIVDSPALETLVKKMKLGKDMPKPANVSALEAVRDLIAVKLTNDLKAKTCNSIDHALELLDPLPPSNWTGLLAMIADEFTRADAQKGKQPDFLICASAS